MVLLFHIAFILMLIFKDLIVSCTKPYEVIPVTLGIPFTLDCRYNCSTGWVRGYWRLKNTGLPNCPSDFLGGNNVTRNGDLCTLPLTVRHPSIKQSHCNYACYLEESDNPRLNSQMVRHVSVRIQARPTTPVLTVTSPLEVTCKSERFYPKDMTVTWSLNDTPLEGGSDLIFRPSGDGTFSCESKITLTPSQYKGTISCEVSHRSLSLPLKSSITLERKNLSIQIYYSVDPEGEDEPLPPSLTIRAREGTFLKLRCLVASSPIATGQWEKRNSSLSWQKIGTDMTLKWDVINKDDAGIYRCQTFTQDISITLELESPAGAFSWLKVLAAITVTVAIVLTAFAVYFCLTCKDKVRAELPAVICKSETADNRTRTTEAMPTVESGNLKWENVAVKVAESDCQSVHEVPYADIIIAVRGSSTPELSHFPDLAPGDYRQRCRHEAGLSPLLPPSRSADRLHVHQREVTRKLSTSSEYAVINYSSEPLS